MSLAFNYEEDPAEESERKQKKDALDKGIEAYYKVYELEKTNEQNHDTLFDTLNKVITRVNLLEKAIANNPNKTDRDIDKFIKLYKSFGINLKPTIDQRKGDNVYIISMIEGENKFLGYSGFYSEIEFDEEGKFVSQGFWE